MHLTVYQDDDGSSPFGPATWSLTTESTEEGRLTWPSEIGTPLVRAITLVRIQSSAPHAEEVQSGRTLPWYGRSSGFDARLQLQIADGARLDGPRICNAA
jgi:hypothetical protein